MTHGRMVPAPSELTAERGNRPNRANVLIPLRNIAVRRLNRHLGSIGGGPKKLEAAQ